MNVNAKKWDSPQDGKKDEKNATIYDGLDLQEKMKMVNVKASSPTSLLARNTVLLPSGVVRVRQLHEIKTISGPGSSTASPSGSATGNPRNKTALAPGHSLMDWIRLGNSGIDLTGVGGVPRVVTLSELANHNKQNDAWIAIRGIVFNVTRYMDFHPGGIDELMRGVGKDATKLFENVHAWVNYQSILQKCVVGRLSRVSSPSSSSIAEKPFGSTNNCSSTTLGFITSCTKQNEEQETISDELRDLSIRWRQTTNSVTFYFSKTVQNYPSIRYQLIRLNDSKLLFKLFLEKDIISHDVELFADVEWPPSWKRDFETMEVEFTFTKKVRQIWKSQGSHTMSKEVNTFRREYKEYEILSNTPLCKLVNMLVLRAKDSMELIPPGRHVEAKMSVMEMEVSRSYTPVPPCLHPEDTAPNYTPDCICLMIKRYPNGALSPSITALKPGQSFTLSGALGAFVVESYDRYSVVHMLAAGTGLTAMLGIIQRALARRNVKTINLLNFNKDEDNMFYAKELDRVSKENRLKVTHILSQAGETWAGRRGAVSEELLKELIGDCSPNGCVFTCGPKGFIETAKKYLENLNWKPPQTHEFDE